MEAKRGQSRFSPPTVGGVSLLVTFAVLCLTVFALLSLSTVRADERLSRASAQAVEDYYAADRAAQEILARLRNGEEPEGVSLYGDTLSARLDAFYADYACPISDALELQVTVRFPGGVDGAYVIERWQVTAVGEWEADEGLDLWDGVLF